MFAISSGGVAALATAVAVFAGVGSCAPSTTPDPPGNATSPAVPTPSEVTDGAPSTAPSTPPGPGTVTAQLFVYYIGLDRDRPRLYREFHNRPAGDGSAAARTRAALTEMLDGDTALDPDYDSSWPAGARVRDVRLLADTVVVDLSGAAANPVGSEYAHQAVQQLVWTATANSGRDRVRVLLDGRPVTELWGHVGIPGDLRRGPAVDVLASVWLINPQQGEVVGRTFEVFVDGTVFEATVNIRVRQGAAVVKETFITVSGGAPARGSGRLSMTLPPGAYTVEAFAFSAADGSVQHLDNHQITVR